MRKDIDISYWTKKEIINKFEQGLSLHFIYDFVACKEIGKVKAKHIVQEIIYQHLMEQKRSGKQSQNRVQTKSNKNFKEC